MTYLRAQSRTGYDRRYEDKVFPAGTRCVEMVDYIGTGGEVDETGEMIGPGDPGNYYGVAYCRAESFYRCFAQARFGGPCIVDIGEFPAEAYDENGEAITDRRINMAACFKHSDLQILPHGCSRYMIGNANDMFAGTTSLRSWTPSEMVAAGLAGVKDPAAPRILHSNGIAQYAFLLNLAPETMKRMWAGSSYDGTGVNAISWSGLKSETAAAGFAEGCVFDANFLDAIIARIYFEYKAGKVRTPLLNVNLGDGVVSGGTAKMARELIDAGIQLEGFVIKD